jgi:hypothetical protein
MFTNLTISQKYDFISKKGKYIGVRQYYNYYINLYLLDDVFYELWFFRDNNTVEKIEAMGNEKKLDLYISNMNRLEK